MFFFLGIYYQIHVQTFYMYMCYHYSQLYGKKNTKKNKNKAPPPHNKKNTTSTKKPNNWINWNHFGKKSAHACMKQYTVSVYDLCQKIRSVIPYVLELLSIIYLPLTQTANTGHPVHDHGINIKHREFPCKVPITT